MAHVLFQKSLLTRPAAVLTAACCESLSCCRRQETTFLEIVVRERGNFLFTVNTPHHPGHYLTSRVYPLPDMCNTKCGG